MRAGPRAETRLRSSSGAGSACLAGPSRVCVPVAPLPPCREAARRYRWLPIGTHGCWRTDLAVRRAMTWRSARLVTGVFGALLGRTRRSNRLASRYRSWPVGDWHPEGQAGSHADGRKGCVPGGQWPADWLRGCWPKDHGDDMADDHSVGPEVTALLAASQTHAVWLAATQSAPDSRCLSPSHRDWRRLGCLLATWRPATSVPEAAVDCVWSVESAGIPGMAADGVPTAQSPTQ